MTDYPPLQPRHKTVGRICCECAYWGDKDLSLTERETIPYLTCFCGPKHPSVHGGNPACDYFVLGLNIRLRLLMEEA